MAALKNYQTETRSAQTLSCILRHSFGLINFVDLSTTLYVF